MPAIYKQTEEQKAEARREASRRAYAKRKADAQASRVVLDDDDDSLPATPSYLAEQARKREAARLLAEQRGRSEQVLAQRQQRELDAQLPAALEAQQAEAMRIIEQAAAGELELDAERAPAPKQRALRSVPREESLASLSKRTGLTERELLADVTASAEREARRTELRDAERAAADTVSKAQIVATLQVLVVSSKRKAQRARAEGKGSQSDYESGVTEGLQTALQLVSDLLAD